MNDSTSNYSLFIDNITGGVSVPVLWASIFFALLGLLLVTLLNIQKGIRENPNTADKFNWKDFGLDSLIRVIISFVITMIVIFVSVRFSNEIFGTPVTMIFSFGIGLGIDKATIAITKYATKGKKNS